MTKFKLGIVVLTIAAMNGFAAEVDRPHCDSKHVGLFWPEAANTDATLIQGFVKSGDLEVCSRTSEWRYRWSQVSISLDQLKKKSKGYREHAGNESNDSSRDAGY